MHFWIHKCSSGAALDDPRYHRPGNYAAPCLRRGAWPKVSASHVRRHSAATAAANAALGRRSVLSEGVQHESGRRMVELHQHSRHPHHHQHQHHQQRQHHQQQSRRHRRPQQPTSSNATNACSSGSAMQPGAGSSSTDPLERQSSTRLQGEPDSTATSANSTAATEPTTAATTRAGRAAAADQTSLTESEVEALIDAAADNLDECDPTRKCQSCCCMTVVTVMVVFALSLAKIYVGHNVLERQGELAGIVFMVMLLFFACLLMFFVRFSMLLFRKRALQTLASGSGSCGQRRGAVDLEAARSGSSHDAGLSQQRAADPPPYHEALLLPAPGAESPPPTYDKLQT